jgi:hypothetical protein
MLCVMIKLFISTTIAIVLVFSVLVISVLGYMEWTENPSTSFRNYAEMADSGIIERGWIPNYIPRSAFEIEETHDIDTNVVQMHFSFEPGDIELPRRNCNSETIVENGILFLCNEGRLRLAKDGKGYFTNAPTDA